MTTKFKFKSKACEAIHSAATDLFKVGAIDKARMNQFESFCLSKPAKHSNLSKASNQGKKR